MILVTYGATWLLSTLSYNTIEEPFLRMRRRYGSDKQVGIGGIVTPP
jgi:peptidoglycan/LPS O-acetylase OafA/YrhL